MFQARNTTLKEDNISLFEKIKFLQSYAGKTVIVMVMVMVMVMVVVMVKVVMVTVV